MPHVEIVSESSTSSPFRIESFTNSSPYNEKGVSLTTIDFLWSFIGASATLQNISPFVGDIAPPALTVSATGLDITENTTFRLSVSDGVANRSKSTIVRFFYPILFGSVPDLNPTELDLKSQDKRIAEYTAFIADITPSNEHSFFISPATNPIKDIFETVFGLSILSTYEKRNITIQMADNLFVPCVMWIKHMLEDTLGFTMDLKIAF
jgi:hypothetical protein